MLIDLIARGNDDRDRLYVHDANGALIGGALFEKTALAAAALAERNLYASDKNLFDYDLMVVKNYHDKVKQQRDAILAERTKLLRDVGVLAKKLAEVKSQQRERIQARAASTGTAAKP